MGIESKDGFDLAQFMRNYDAKKRKESNNNDKPESLTLAHLMNRKPSRTFIKDSSG
jgi:hypothetical protein